MRRQKHKQPNGFEGACLLIGGFLVLHDLSYLIETAVFDLSLRAFAQRLGSWNNQLVAGLAISALGLLVWKVRVRRGASKQRDASNV